MATSGSDLTYYCTMTSYNDNSMEVKSKALDGKYIEGAAHELQTIAKSISPDINLTLLYFVGASQKFDKTIFLRDCVRGPCLQQTLQLSFAVISLTYFPQPFIDLGSFIMISLELCKLIA